jgi:hypothetical protein
MALIMDYPVRYNAATVIMHSIGLTAGAMRCECCELSPPSQFRLVGSPREDWTQQALPLRQYKEV